MRTRLPSKHDKNKTTSPIWLAIAFNLDTYLPSYRFDNSDVDSDNKDVIDFSENPI